MKRIRALAGEMAARISDYNWAETPLGPIESWPQTLVTTLGVMLGSRFPIQILWGEQYIHFYNDAYIPIAGDKHPAALGAPGGTVWPEIWDVVRPMLDGVRATGQATWADDMRMMLVRGGQIEEAYFTFSYGPIWGDSSVDGIFIAVTETTRRVIAERRLHSGRDLSAALVGLRVEEEVCRRAATALAHNEADLPFLLLYLAERAGDRLTLAAAAHLGSGHPAAPAETTVAGGPWPFAQALADERAVLVPDLPATCAALPGGPWGAPPTSALVVPLRSGGEFAPLGYMVVGLSPHQPLDDEYRAFIERLATQISGQVAAARAYAVAHEAVQLRDDFLSVAAHELKNPLTPLIGRLQMIERRLVRTRPDEHNLTAIRQAIGEARRLADQIDTLLDVSRMRGGQLSLARSVFDLAALCREVVADLAPTLGAHTLSLAAADAPAPVEGDAGRMGQVLRNLLGNAIKYSPRGGDIVVRLTAAEGLARLAVVDQGIGIPEEARPRLFTRYYRAGNAADQPVGGLGIGLFVVHEIVRLHGGRVEVQSALGVGSTFTVVLPLAGGADGAA